MKAHFHKVPIPLQNSFSIRRDKHPYFPKGWHYHPELELQLTVRGEGVRFIGDNVSNFVPGEIVFLGENLPHTWRSSNEYYTENSNLHTDAVIIQFLPNCLGKDFFSLPETQLIGKLFQKAGKGLLIKGRTRDALEELMIRSIKTSGMDRMLIFLSMLKLLSETKDYETIAKGFAFYRSNEAESIRLNDIYSYTLSNYSKDISIDEAAAVANLSHTSFCRYFKMMTNRTFNTFLIEIRISHACRYLIEDRLSMDMICQECGFNNISNFYRHFKKLMNVTPNEYKRQYTEDPRL